MILVASARMIGMSALKIGINGFGRIGRAVLRIVAGREDIEVAGVHDLADAGDLAYLLRYDSVHGRFGRAVESRDDAFVIDGNTVPYFRHKAPSELPWGELGCDIVIEASGVMTKRASAAGHLEGGAKLVVISAPAKDGDGMFVLGVNGDEFDASKHQVISLASCTTNCLAPVAKVLLDAFGVENIVATTVHAYTGAQAILDRPARKRRRGRAGAMSIIPTTTGAAVATGIVIPELAGKLDGIALRVPVPDGSITDIVARLEKPATVDEVNAALRQAADGPMKGFLEVSDDELVSADIIGNPHSSIVDARSTMLVGDRTVKILSWYDNEWGYANRLVDFALFAAARMG